MTPFNILGSTSLSRWPLFGWPGLDIGGGVLETDFLWTVATTTPSETFTIPCQNVGTFDALVDWGDGSTSAIIAYNDAALTHTYASAGDHQIRISGTFPSLYFTNLGDTLKVKSVENFGVVGWSQCVNAFWGCSNMTSFVSGNTDTSGVTTMSTMFFGCSSLTSLDVTSFDTSAVTDTRNMFRGCSSLTALDVASFDTSAVTDMRNMILGCASLTDIIGVEDFNIAGLDGIDALANFARGVTIPTARYDALLIKWDAQNPLDGMSPNFGTSTYTGGGTAAAARANLISTDGWIITDGGIA